MKSSTTELQLIEGCRAGNRLAQQELFERFRRKMFTVCLRYLPDNFEAEDILLQGFLKVFNNLKQFSGQGSFEGWIRRIIVNEALMALRAKKMLFVEASEIHHSQLSAVPEQLGFSLDTDDLMAMVQNLPEGYRTVFNLYAIEGYSHKEIGDMLGISEGTSKSQLSRARVILQGKLEVIQDQNNTKRF
jgi:RNA polymerase sigma factor (sigma-70 family)